MTHKIRTTMRPDQVIEVDDAEYLDLQRQNLVLADHIEQAAAAAPAPTKAVKATSKEG